jgi:hypothetical protein
VKIRFRVPSPALIVACIALFVTLSGVGYAALIGVNTVASPQVVNNSLKGADVDEASLALPGKVTALLQGRSGALPIEATFKTSGKPVLINAAGSGYGAAGSQIGMLVRVDGIARGEVKSFTNEASSHKAFVENDIAVTNLGPGTHTLKLEVLSGTTTDANDFFTVSVLELPVAMNLGPDGSEPTNNSAGSSVPYCAAPAFSGLPYRFGTIWPATDKDWIDLNCTQGGFSHARITVVGARMDVYPWGASTGALATNVTSFQGTNNFYQVRVRATKPGAYTLGEIYLNPAPAARSTMARPDGRVVAVN